MKAQRVDPRDGSWEVDRPVYRVYFWGQLDASEGGMWASDEWELTDADDVMVVRNWAELNSNGRRFVMYVTVQADDGLGMIRLLGVDPSA